MQSVLFIACKIEHQVTSVAASTISRASNSDDELVKVGDWVKEDVRDWETLTKVHKVLFLECRQGKRN